MKNDELNDSPSGKYFKTWIPFGDQKIHIIILVDSYFSVDLFGGSWSIGSHICFLIVSHIKNDSSLVVKYLNLSLFNLCNVANIWREHCTLLYFMSLVSVCGTFLRSLLSYFILVVRIQWTVEGAILVSEEIPRTDKNGLSSRALCIFWSFL